MEEALVPVGEIALCFNESDFTSKSFSVDGFVRQARSRVTLSQLRDDLKVYQKLLSSALIELINKDYADFLNLSSTLIGMDKAILNLMTPLERFRSEILDVSKSIKTVETAVDDQLKDARKIRERRSDLERLVHIIHCVEKIEKLLDKSGMGDSEDASHKGGVVERIASELNQLHFHVAKAQGMDLMSSIQPRIAYIANALQTNLEEDFVASLEKKDVEAIRRCLRIHVTIDRVPQLESIFRIRVVRPYFEKHVNIELFSRPGASEKDALAVLFASLLDIVSAKCSILQEASAGGAGLEVVSGYDFLVNSVWPEIVSFLESRAPSLFALGSPTSFHPRFLASMAFLENFEEQCGNLESVRRLRAHPSYLVFINKFNLPVYFQIRCVNQSEFLKMCENAKFSKRFQEISCSFEKSLTMRPLSEWVNRDGSCRLHASETLVICLNQCWDDGVFLSPLVHRFLKLSVQLLSRFCVWLQSVSKMTVKDGSSSSDDSLLSVDAGKEGPLTKNMSTSDLPSHAEKSPGMARTATTANFSLDNNDVVPESALTVDQAVNLVSDIANIRDYVSELVSSRVFPKIERLGVTTLDQVQECFNESFRQLECQEEQVAQILVNHLTSGGMKHLKGIMDIPRLFRRTNREISTKASSYIVSALNPVSNFRLKFKDCVHEVRMKKWLLDVSDVYGKQLYGSINEVLTSVQKMEESLKRLKRMKAGQKTEDATLKTSDSLTDDEKIRHQLWLDAHYFGDKVKEEFGVDSQSVDLLLKLVDKAKAPIGLEN
ncbi:unnamed protein product [Notodromas monacha]|uniref:Conserved oligomeric Golgi complex subunit 2 n=1 Tax=Notodromas monacha TaxID=399045 RepID=A0A7R9GA86_9CRUS|nr:unnamed protein product [Notodromas monacha]CAG0913848.1 unnamed protein product [Notodromas monacha]